MSELSRNAPCSCGSGKRYKHCCGADKPALPNSPLAQLKAHALAVHGSGDLALAGKLYAEILQASPDDFDALHMLGVVHGQAGRNFEALDFLVRALGRAPEEKPVILPNLRRVMAAIVPDVYTCHAHGLPIPEKPLRLLQQGMCVLAQSAPAPDAWRPPEHGTYPTPNGFSVLVIDEIVPTPDRDSGSLRLVGMLEAMVRAGCKVSFFAVMGGLDAGCTVRLEQAGIRMLNRAAPFLFEELASHGTLYDLVVVCRYPNAHRYLPYIKSFCPNALTVFDTVDLHHWREWRQAVLTRNPSINRQAALTRSLELGAIREADLTWVVSDAEQRLLEEEIPREKLEILSNIHEIRGCRNGHAGRRDMFFLGGFHHPPNRDAVIWFVDAVWPSIRIAIPDIRLLLIGSGMPEKIRALEGNGVVPVGYVADLDPYLDSCRVSIAPLRFGAGVKGKVNMALASGVPVVATPIAVEGMHLRPGLDVLVAEDAQTFAAEVVRLYQDPELWSGLSGAGLAVSERYFSAAQADQAISRVLDAVQQRRRLPSEVAPRRREPGSPQRCLVLTTAGFGSLGDEAMMLGLLSTLKSYAMPPDIDLLSIYPGPGWPLVRGATDMICLARNAFPEKPDWVAALSSLFERYDAFILIGADVLDGYYSVEESLERLEMVATATQCGLLTSIMGFSVNAQIAPPVAQALRALPESVRLFARDAVSVRRLNACGVQGVQSAADLAFLMQPRVGPAPFNLVEVEHWLAEMRASGRRLVACCLSTQVLEIIEKRDPEFVKSFARFLARLMDGHGVSVLLLSHDLRPARNNNDDVSLAMRLSQELAGLFGHEQRHRAVFPSSADEAKRLMGQIDLLLSARMHLAIAALGMGRPVIGLGYQGKFEGLLERFGLSNWLIESESFQFDALRQICEQALNTLPESALRVQARLPEVADLSRFQVDRLMAEWQLRFSRHRDR